MFDDFAPVHASDASLPIAALAAAAPAPSDHIMLRHGKGRDQTVEAGMLHRSLPGTFGSAPPRR